LGEAPEAATLFDAEAHQQLFLEVPYPNPRNAFEAHDVLRMETEQPFSLKDTLSRIRLWRTFVAVIQHPS
jgi:hypothetical protein